MPDTTTPDTLAGIHARYREIAPLPTPESKTVAHDIAVSLLVAAQRANALLLTPGEPLNHDLISAMADEFAVVHLLCWLREHQPEEAARLSGEIVGAWEDGGGIGEWLWEHAQALGIDIDEVNHLAEAEAVLRGEKRKAETPGTAAEALHALAAKWDATAARNQRNGQSLIDQGDEYGNEGLAVAEALGACVVELRALLSDMEPTRPEPATEAAPAAKTAPAT